MACNGFVRCNSACEQVHVAEKEQGDAEAEAPPELRQLREVFPDRDHDQLVAVLDASNWNVEEATMTLLGGGGAPAPAQQRGTRLHVRDVFGKGKLLH